MTQTAPRPTATGTADGVAARLAEAVRPFIGGDLPVRLQAWDGSVAGPEDGPLVVLRSPDALRRLLWHPGELGAAQAYVTGELDVPERDGWTLESALTHAFAVGAECAAWAAQGHKVYPFHLGDIDLAHSGKAAGSTQSESSSS